MHKNFCGKNILVFQLESQIFQLQWSLSGRILVYVRVCVCLDAYRLSGSLMAVVSTVTSPSNLSVVTDPVPWLWIMGGERAHPEALFAVTLQLSPANEGGKIGSLSIAVLLSRSAFIWTYCCSI